jgi:ectoine hydroxylase-related dioxygenase (phytanoyl-CoA dioxygenase family)
MTKGAYTGNMGSEMPLRPMTISQRSPNRFEITLKMTGPFGNPALFANPIVLSILKMSLSDQLQLSSLTSVVSFPGAAFQRIHRDYPLIYGSNLLHTVNPNDLPSYAIGVTIPLVDVDLRMGPTEVWLGSHLWPGDYLPPSRHGAVKSNLEMGDCMMSDFRLVHAGGPNSSSHVRPMIVALYARPWFHDDVGNHPVDKPVDLPLDKWLAFDKPTQKLTMRAYTQAIRAMK